MRAAEYVRISTDQQQYSILSQQAAIAEYAAKHGFEIVRTYSDPAKSGLDIKHRPGLQNLIDDVTAGRADYEAVLVFDVSRWGRFQDCDEAACYEFLCKRAGIKVHYCAEPFTNDLSATSTLLKMMKRTMAAEYLRDLSIRVKVGQCRLAANGFKQGGAALMDFRRLLVDADGNRKMILQRGERKSIATDRVSYVLGPEHEIRLIQGIYSMFLDQNVSITGIASLLNERGVKHLDYRPWRFAEIYRILTHPAYMGCSVFNRTSVSLGSKRIMNPRDQWVLCPKAHPAIVPRDRFEQAQEKIENSVKRRSNDRLLAEFKSYIEAHGHPPPYWKRTPGMGALKTYASRFGGLAELYKLVNYRGSYWTPESVRLRRTCSSMKLKAMTELQQAFVQAGLKATAGDRSFEISGKGIFLLELGQFHLTGTGLVRWKVKVSRQLRNHGVILIRLAPGNEDLKDFLFFRKLSKGRFFWLTDKLIPRGSSVRV